MALTYTPPGELGALAPDFSLKGVDGGIHRLADFSNARALVVTFMCNHCPYVKAVQGRINALAREYAQKGVALVGINPNDSVRYPDDSFEAMQAESRKHGYVFPYLHDETQEVARAYGAVCTPDFYAYAPTGEGFALRYRGRLDDSWKDEAAVRRRDLASALDAILSGGTPSPDQLPSMGCSIKWK
jgi:peroxiredoxin